MKITIQIKNVYGKEAIYPICEKGKIFAEIAGTKTLTRQTIQQIKSLGYEIEVMQVALD